MNNAWPPSKTPQECAAALEAFSPPTPPIHSISLDWCIKEFSAEIDVLRLDLLDSELGGNKWYKLKPHLNAAFNQGKTRVISFGGAHSNHLYALAAAAQRFGFASLGIVRGLVKEGAPLTPTLSDAVSYGMQLQFVSRAEYAQRYDQQWCQQLAAQHNAYLIPEGGASETALEGLAELARFIAPKYDKVLVACGTGTTLAGLVRGLSKPAVASPCVTGISALKDDGSTAARVSQLLAASEHTVPWTVNANYHGGGFAKLSPELVAFIDQFEQHTHIPLDPVYNSKLFFAVVELIKTGELKVHSTTKGANTLVLHTGGLQGGRAMADRMARMRHRSR